MSGTLCLALRMERLYKPVRYVALGRALPHDIWIGAVGPIQRGRRRRGRHRWLRRAEAARHSVCKTCVFLNFLPPVFVFGHEDASWQKFFARFFTQPLAVFLSRHFFCRGRPPKRRGWRGTSAAAAAVQYSHDSSRCDFTISDQHARHRPLA